MGVRIMLRGIYLGRWFKGLRLELQGSIEGVRE